MYKWIWQYGPKPYQALSGGNQPTKAAAIKDGEFQRKHLMESDRRYAENHPGFVEHCAKNGVPFPRPLGTITAEVEREEPAVICDW